MGQQGVVTHPRDDDGNRRFDSGLSRQEEVDPVTVEQRGKCKWTYAKSSRGGKPVTSAALRSQKGGGSTVLSAAPAGPGDPRRA